MKGKWFLAGVLVLAALLALAVGPGLAQGPEPQENVGIRAVRLAQVEPEPIVVEPSDQPPHPNTWTTGGGFLYWARNCSGGEFRWPGYLRRKPLNGGLVDTLATVDESNCATFWSMAADDSGLYYYNAEEDRFEFRSVSDPETPVSVVATTSAPFGDIDLEGEYLYWFHLYWIGDPQLGTLLRVRKDGAGNIQAVANARPNPGHGHDVLAVGNTVYFLDGTGLNSVDCSTFPCSTPVRLVPGTRGRDLHYLDETVVFPSLHIDYSIYWVEESTPERLHRYRCVQNPPRPRTCSDTVLYTAPDNHWKIYTPLTQGDNLYFAEVYYLNDGRIRRMPKGGGTVETIVTGRPFMNTNPAIQVDSRYVYFLDPPKIYRVPLDAAAITWDLKADAMEVTQAIQNLDNSVPLVAEKPTYVRAYARLLNGPAARNVEARLHGSRGGSPLPGSPLSPLNGDLALSTSTTYDRANLDDGWLFRLPRSWVNAGTITLRLEVDPNGVYDDSNPSNNQLSRSVTFNGKAPVCVVFVPVRTHGPYASLDNPNFWPMIDMATRLWPTPGYWPYYQTEDIAEYHLFWFSPYELPEDDWKVLSSLNTRDTFSDDPDECDSLGAKTHYVGMVHNSVNTGSVLGSSYRNDNVAWIKFPPESPTSSNDFDWPGAGVTLAHELGHNQGRKHVDCGGPADTDPGYPYPTNQIGRVDPRGYYGFDPQTERPIPPDGAADYMSYCRPRWTSDYTWRAIFNTLHDTRTALQAAQVDTSMAGSLVLVTGGINPTTNQGTLNYAWVYPATAMSTGMRAKWMEAMARTQATQVGTTANYVLRLRNPSGDIIAEHPVTLLEAEDIDGETKAFMLTFSAPGDTVATLELAADGTVLDSRSPGINIPTVTIQRPAAGEVVDNALVLQWRARDPDPGDVLLFSVQYSPDNGTTWYALLTDYPALQGTDTVSLTISNPAIPESGSNQGRIRVLASDGYHTGMDTSQGFTVTNRKPRAFIASPTQGENIPAGRTVVLRGAGMDIEDGRLAPGRLRWHLNGRNMGSGEEVEAAGLAPGHYQAQLTATDSKNMTDTAAVDFQIAPLDIPEGSEPTLDGFCDDDAYASSTSLLLAPYSDGRQAKVSLLRTGGYLWVCFSNMARGAGTPIAFAGVRVDVNNSRDPLAQNNDYGFFVREDGTPFTYRGNGAGGFADPGPGGLAAQVSANDAAWSAELRIDRAVLNGWNHMVSLNLGHYWVRYQGDDYEWPFDTVWNKPNTWALTALGYLPRLERLEPASAVAGNSDLSLVVRGMHFQSGAVVRWNGTDLTTRFGNTTVLTATVPAALLASPGTAQISVRNPGSSDFVSNALLFMVESPVPKVTALSPSQAAQGSRGFTLTVDGQYFLDGAQVLWDGVALPTTYVSGTRLTAAVDTTKLAVAGTMGIAVRNPGPNAPISAPATFTVFKRCTTYLPLVLRNHR